MIDLNSKHRRKTALLMAAAMSASLFLTACGSDKPVEPTPATSTPTTPGTSGTLPGGLISDVPINVTTAPQDTVSGPDASDPATAEPNPAIPSGVNYLTGLPQADETINSRRPSSSTTCDGRCRSTALAQPMWSLKWKQKAALPVLSASFQTCPPSARLALSVRHGRS